MKPPEGIVIRAGYSANAGIILEKRTGVLALNEKLVQFEGDKPYVEVKVADGKFERRDLTVAAVGDGVDRGEGRRRRRRRDQGAADGAAGGEVGRGRAATRSSSDLPRRQHVGEDGRRWRRGRRA